MTVTSFVAANFGKKLPTLTILKDESERLTNLLGEYGKLLSLQVMDQCRAKRGMDGDTNSVYDAQRCRLHWRKYGTNS